jgi:hypothetical protein
MTPTDARAAYDGELVDQLDLQVRALVRSEGVDALVGELVAREAWLPLSRQGR